MDFIDLAAKRYSVRKFKKEPIAKAELDIILKAGCVAPTAHNEQPQRILVINNEEALAKLKKCTACHFDSPTALLICADKAACWVRKYDSKPSYDIDAAIVTTHMMLAAESLGIGSTWVMHFRPQVVREEFALPDNYEPTAMLMLGYPAPDAEPAALHFETKPQSEMVFYNEYK